MRTRSDAAGPPRSPAPTISPVRRLVRGPWPAVIAGLLCYLNSLGGGFVYDDAYVIAQNARIQSLTNFREIWLDNWWAPLPDGTAPDRLYRPLTLFTFALNRAVGGLAPAGYHIVNVFLHALGCALVWRLGRSLCGDVVAASIAALLFAVHPVHVEAVANLVGRAELLAALFLCAGVIALLPADAPPRVGRVWIAAGLFFLALLSKETAVCYIGVAAVALFAGRAANPTLANAPARSALPAPPPDRAGTMKRELFCGLILLLPLAAYMLLRYVALDGHLLREAAVDPLVNPLAVATVGQRAVGVFTILGEYVRLTLFPFRLSCDYGLAVVDPAAGVTPLTVLGFIVAAGTLALLAGLRSRSHFRRRLAQLALITIFSYALISNAVLTIGVSLGERLFYWPSIPVLLAIALGAVATVRVVWKRAFAAPHPVFNPRVAAIAIGIVGIAIVLSLAGRTILRNADWRTNRTLYAADVAAFPKSVRLNVLYAIELIQDMQNAAARSGASAAPTGSSTAGAAPERVRTEVRRHLEAALALYPDHPFALEYLAGLYRDRGDIARATEMLERLARVRPNEWQWQANLAMLLIERDPDAALRHARDAARMAPDAFEARVALIEALAATGETEGALRRLRELENDTPASHPLRSALRERRRQLEAAANDRTPP